MYLLDTDIIIDFLNNDSSITKEIEKKANQPMFISSLTLCELYRGAFLSTNPEEEQKNIFNLIASTEFLSLDKEACRIFGKNNAYLSKIGKMTQEVDLMISSIAISKELTLVTRNKKHFENIPGLKMEEW
ncbi:MAG: type II toxin-antitoxin system VapC family toxin [Nanoarchaeota archaeon]|nr:type II toxin-antitoxin system VapC family toxin [Nanoarchaeota archaeon]MBU1005369.1 type II toxin-antitoxin system VapC family toxin [Nanoarchaeota archaeon]MBU1946075.1 type II toxin-antitoxin system VapC family toxin [Nanoarchaeota archaeon]